MPISARAVELRIPTGAEELFLLESPAGDSETAAGLLDAILGSAKPGGSLLEWPVTDFEWLLLQLRGMLLGRTVRTDVRCPAPGCGVKIEVQFDIGDYVDDALAASLPDVQDAEGGRFPPPTVADQIACSAATDPEAELVRRCIPSAEPDSEEFAAIENALEQAAPALSRELEGLCPECGEAVPMYFDAVGFVLEELRGQARFVLEDVDRLAARYHWSEQAILSLPSIRRARYAELAAAAERAE